MNQPQPDPGCLAHGRKFNAVMFEREDGESTGEMIARANHWMNENPGWGALKERHEDGEMVAVWCAHKDDEGEPK